MQVFPCHYLSGEVELSDERETHIAETHPDLLPEYLAQIGQTLADPDQVRRSLRMSTARLFCRWFDDVRLGKYVVVVVVSETVPVERHWIITAYITRRLASGGVEWQRRSYSLCPSSPTCGMRNRLEGAAGGTHRSAAGS